MIDLSVRLRVEEDGTYVAETEYDGETYTGEGTELVSAMRDLALSLDDVLDGPLLDSEGAE